MKQPRSVGMCVVLSIITCGIYGWYWMYCIHEDMQIVCDRPMSVSGGMVIVLTIVTCGIYGIYWSYKMGQFLDAAKGVPGGNSGLVYLLLSIFGLDIIAWALMQSELNCFTTGSNDL